MPNTLFTLESVVTGTVPVRFSMVVSTESPHVHTSHKLTVLTLSWTSQPHPFSSYRLRAKMATVQRLSALSSFTLFQELMRSPQAAIARRRRRQRRIGRRTATLKRRQSQRNVAIALTVMAQFLLYASLTLSNRSVWSLPR